MSRQRLAATRLLMQLLEAEGDLVSLPSGGEYRDEIDLLILERLIRAAVRREWLRCPECHEQEARVQTEMPGNRFKGFCTNCGAIEIPAAAVLRFSIQWHELIAHLCAGLNVGAAERKVVLPKQAWYLGTTFSGAKQRAWYFARMIDRSEIAKVIREQIHADRCDAIATVVTSANTDQLQETRLRDIEVVRLDAVALLGTGRFDFNPVRMPHPVDVPEEADEDLPDTTFRFVRGKGYARVNGENIPLSPQEKAILIAFFDQPEHELNKRELQDASGSQAQNFKPNQALKRIPQVAALVHYLQVERLYWLDIPIADVGLDL